MISDVDDAMWTTTSDPFPTRISPLGPCQLTPAPSFQTHLSFGREFTEAVEMKQVAQQQAEQARYLVEKAEQMKLAAITTAEGDAQASKLLAQAFKQAGPGLIELRRIEAAEEIAELLAKNRNVVYLPKDIHPLLAIN